MNIVIISALGNEAARRCIDSLYATTRNDNFNLFVFHETGFREQTLNTALNTVGTSEDVLFVGDDIQFTQGWYEALLNHYSKADILGMSMLYPNTTKVQDRGYDLVQIEEQITVEAADRGEDKSAISNFGFRYVDSLCGCFVFIKSNVLKKIELFSEEGQNRFGEFIFFCEAREQGAKVGLIDHFLYHGGVSTKSNPNKKLSSISYTFEKEIWRNIVKKYVDPSWVKKQIQQTISDELQELLSISAGKVLIYGIGTVTEFLGTKCDFTNDRFTFCTGLPEEAGMKVFNNTVVNINDLNLINFDLILITPLYIADKIFQQALAPLLPEKNTTRIFAIETDKKIDEIKYIIKELTESQASFISP